MSRSSEFAAFAQERGVSGGWDDPGMKRCLNEYLEQRNMGLSKQTHIQQAIESGAEQRGYTEEEYREWCYLQHREQVRKDPLRSFGDFINSLVDPEEKEEKPPADDVQPGESDE